MPRVVHFEIGADKPEWAADFYKRRPLVAFTITIYLCHILNMAQVDGTS
jgi:predicted enzyme related to lactoylglutathione lyase